MRGIINLRGQLIPIIDMRLRLGKMPEDEHCIMVVNVENNVVGLLVDGVERMACWETREERRLVTSCRFWLRSMPYWP